MGCTTKAWPSSTAPTTTTITGDVDTKPAGLDKLIVTIIPINDTTWTELPSSPLTGRRQIDILNDSGFEIKINSDSVAALPVGYVGFKMPNNFERQYQFASGSLAKLYAKATGGAGSVTITVEELA